MLRAKVSFFFINAAGAEVFVIKDAKIPEGDAATKGRTDFFEVVEGEASAPRRKTTKGA